MSTTQAAIREFQVTFPQEDLDELRRRLAATRLPSQELVANASQGVQLATVQALTQYWGAEYDLSRVETRLHALTQVTNEIDGLKIQFIHIKYNPDNTLDMCTTH